MSMLGLNYSNIVTVDTNNCSERILLHSKTIIDDIAQIKGWLREKLREEAFRSYDSLLTTHYDEMENLIEFISTAREKVKRDFGIFI